MKMLGIAIGVFFAALMLWAVAAQAQNGGQQSGNTNCTDGKGFGGESRQCKLQERGEKLTQTHCWTQCNPPGYPPYCETHCN
jgi:hypothetical protein